MEKNQKTLKGLQRFITEVEGLQGEVMSNEES